MDAQIPCLGRSDLAGLPALKSTILAALDGDDDVVLVVDGLEQAPFGFFQLVEAARLHAGARGKAIRLSGPLAGAAAEALATSGLLAGREPAASSFWTHEDTPA